MNELALFAGAGGGILGGTLLGWRTVAAVEIEEYPRAVLLQRQADGILPRFPIWDDVRTFDGEPWRGRVDVITGGFPCQDISAAGKGAGITGDRSGLWFEFSRIIGEVRPRFVLVENSPLLVSRGLDTVLGDLAALGFDAEWGMFSGSEVGCPAEGGERLFIVAKANDGSAIVRRDRPLQPNEAVSQSRNHNRRRAEELGGGQWWEVEPRPVGVVDWCPDRVDRITAIGNAQIPALAALAWETLYERIGGGGMK